MSRFVPAANLDVVLDHATHDDRLKVAEHMAIDARHNVNPNTGNYAEEVQTFDDDRGVGAGVGRGRQCRRREEHQK